MSGGRVSGRSGPVGRRRPVASSWRDPEVCGGRLESQSVSFRLSGLFCLIAMLSNLISGCKGENMEKPVITSFTLLDVIKNNHVVNCTVAVCAVFSCEVTIKKNESNFYYISGNVSSGWIEQTGLRAAVFELVSSASLDYDKSKYIFFSSDLQHTAPSLQINTQVELYEEANLTKQITGGVIGGLLLLALITAALYKGGFFKSQYKQMLQEAQGDAGEEPNMTE